MRKNIVAGNWKMNNNLPESKKLVKGIKKAIEDKILDNTRVIVSPSHVNLRAVVKKAKKSAIEVAAQNMHQADSGAFTGEISADMLKSIGIKTVILGHSERREYFGETDKLLAEKVDQALKNNLEIIFCFGEKLEERKSEKHFKVVESQLKNALFHLEANAWKNIILAYEPVWAIGTGETASPEQAQEMHAFIRDLISKKYDAETANNVSILYGGSVKPNNAVEIFSKEDVDGGLIGGASLKSEDFVALIDAI
ncbi:triose-phosphate isomerase [Aureibaculum sp. 2210JD6-5]|uniref:triose-phosphate isomerase n=1 Tax=Aureibaculum sp. 2210JD6-5 TaxID=3103957 RepID=UPI002AAC7CB2|nr:triose-phosphate isomerase [Aureibaculum sp. 2210JD6-5]MDY7394870.1 triose-phosphate isomerase [Aureibaculum sp. 2210JD6-5]